MSYSPLINKVVVCIKTMAPHGKELTAEQKQIIMSLSNNGYSSYKIQDLTNINSRTIQKFFKRVRERGNIEISSEVEVRKRQKHGMTGYYSGRLKETEDRH